MDFKLGVLLIISAQICTTLALPPCTCTLDLTPVCGSDGVDYDNECMLKCAAQNSGKTITVTKAGPCEGSSPTLVVAEPSPCSPCPLIYAPVCGSDGEEYSNDCVLDCKRKQFNPSLKIEHYGPCTVDKTALNP